MNGFEQYQYAEMMRQSRNSAIYHMLLARQGVAGGDAKQEDPTPPEPVIPEKTTFHFADSSEEYLIEGTLDRSKMIELGLYNDSFGWIKQPTSIEIGNKVTSIGDYTFEGCGDLTSVTIGNGVKSLGLNVFMGCNSLTTLAIPSSVETIGVAAFYDTSLEELIMENRYTTDVESMAEYAWGVPAGIPIKCTDGDLEAPEPGGS